MEENLEISNESLSIYNSDLYINKKEIISIKGNINIYNLYNKEVYFNIAHIILCFLVFLILLNILSIWYLYLYLILVFGWIILSNNYYYLKYKDLNIEIKNYYYFDSLLKLSYIFYLIGMILQYNNQLNMYFVLFIIPNFLVSVYFFIIIKSKSSYIIKKRMSIIQTVQFLIIYLKLCNKLSISWFNTFFIFIIECIFFILVGLILFFIFLLNLRDYQDNNIPLYYIKGIFYLFINYVLFGIGYFILIYNISNYLENNYNEKYSILKSI